MVSRGVGPRRKFRIVRPIRGGRGRARVEEIRSTPEEKESAAVYSGRFARLTRARAPAAIRPPEYEYLIRRNLYGPDWRIRGLVYVRPVVSRVAAGKFHGVELPTTRFPVDTSARRA